MSKRNRKNSLNKKQIILSKFKFLLYNEFYIVDSHKTNFYLSFIYKKDNINIIPSYDFREKIFSVGIKDSNDDKPWRIKRITDTSIGTSNSKKCLLDSVNKIKEEYKRIIEENPGFLQNLFNRKHIRKENEYREYMFLKFTDLYAEFVRDNIDDIINWKYNMDK